MSASVNPDIVTDGLVLCLDAGNPDSYPGSGTTWNDLSGNGNNGILINGPTFDSNNRGNIVFDGVNDYVNLGKPSSLNFGINSFTISIWIKPTVGNITKVIASKGAVSAINSSGWWFALDSRYNGNTEGVSFSVNSTSVNNNTAAKATLNKYTINSWNNLVVVWNSVEKDLYFYINTLVSSTTTVQTAGTGLSGVTNTDNSSFDTIISAYNNGTSSYLQSNIAQFKIYNKALSANEVSQNYKALKGRYGL